MPPSCCNAGIVVVECEVKGEVRREVKGEIKASAFAGLHPAMLAAFVVAIPLHFFPPCM